MPLFLETPILKQSGGSPKQNFGIIFVSVKVGDEVPMQHTIDSRNPAKHLGCMKPCKKWDELLINCNWCKISSINSIIQNGDLNSNRKFELKSPVFPNIQMND